MQVVEVEGLTKRFGALCAVDDLIFTVRAGTIVGFSARTAPGRPRRCDAARPDPTAGRAFVYELSEELASLEDVFLELTADADSIR